MNNTIMRVIHELISYKKKYNPKLHWYTIKNINCYCIELISDLLLTNSQLDAFERLLKDIYSCFPKKFYYEFSFFYCKSLPVFFELDRSAFFIKKYRLVISTELKDIHEIVHGFSSSLNSYANKVLEEGLAMYLSWYLTNSIPKDINFDFNKLLDLKNCKTDEDYIQSGLLVKFLISNRKDFFQIYQNSSANDLGFIKHILANRRKRGKNEKQNC